MGQNLNLTILEQKLNLLWWVETISKLLNGKNSVKPPIWIHQKLAIIYFSDHNLINIAVYYELLVQT